MSWAGALLSEARLLVMYRLLTLGALPQLRELRLDIHYVTLKVRIKIPQNSRCLMIIRPMSNFIRCASLCAK